MEVTLYLLDNIYSGNFIIFKRPTPAISATHGARFNLLFPKYKKETVRIRREIYGFSERPCQMIWPNDDVFVVL